MPESAKLRRKANMAMSAAHTVPVAERRGHTVLRPGTCPAVVRGAGLVLPYRLE